MSDRAVRVARVSSNRQQEAAQVPITTAWCADHGYETSDARLILIHGRSAKTGAHLAQLEQAVGMVEAGLAEVIVMVRLDRMSRQGLDAALDLRRRVKAAGGRWEFARQQRLNGNGIEADREWARRAIDAQEESELRLERIAEGFAESVANGAATAKCKYGWTMTGFTQDKRWAADDARRATVEGIFTRVADGMPLRAVCAWARTQDDSVKFWLEHVRAMIGDRAYIGEVSTTVNGQPYTFAVPPLVTVELWTAANAALGDPKRYRATPQTRFTGILYCGCGGSLRRTSANRLGARYWACRACRWRIRDDVAMSSANDALTVDGRELYDETLVRPADTRGMRRGALERELAGLSRSFGADIDGMIARAVAIKSELGAIDAEQAPRGHIERQPTGRTLGSLYRELDEKFYPVNRLALDVAAENALGGALRAHSVRVVFQSKGGSLILNAGLAADTSDLPD